MRITNCKSNEIEKKKLQHDIIFFLLIMRKENEYAWKMNDYRIKVMTQNCWNIIHRYFNNIVQTPYTTTTNSTFCCSTKKSDNCRDDVENR